MGKSRDLANLLADNAVGTSEIADDAITSAKILNSAVTANKIGNNAVTADKINDGAVTSGKLASGAAALNIGSYVTSVNGQSGAVTVSASPTTAQVLTATAGASFGAVGTYVQPYSAPSTSLGGTQAGSSLVFLDGGGSPYTGAVGGTWRSFGRGLTPSSELWLRIS